MKGYQPRLGEFVIKNKEAECPKFSSFSDPSGYGGMYPSRSYIMARFVDLVDAKRPYLDSEVQRRHGQLLKIDASHKVTFIELEQLKVF